MMLVYPHGPASVLIEDLDTGEVWACWTRQGGWQQRARWSGQAYGLTLDGLSAWPVMVGNVALAILGAPHEPVTLAQCEQYVEHTRQTLAALAEAERAVPLAYQQPSEREPRRLEIAEIQARIAALAGGAS